jgi:imidazole glycerol phosphate synthase subunit HisF
MEMFTSVGLGMSIMDRGNTPLLKEWCTTIVKSVGIPLIIKMSMGQSAKTMDAIKLMIDCGVPIFHVVAQGARDIGLLAETCPFLIVGGGIGTTDDARRALDAGADAVAIATAAMKNPALCGRIQGALRGKA